MTIRYFIPDWDDRVDPGYDFLSDTHTPGRYPYRDDCYAHELYGSPPYDGILLSLATLDANPNKREAIQAAGSVHRYLRCGYRRDPTRCWGIVGRSLTGGRRCPLTGRRMCWPPISNWASTSVSPSTT